MSFALLPKVMVLPWPWQLSDTLPPGYICTLLFIYIYIKVCPFRTVFNFFHWSRNIACVQRREKKTYNHILHRYQWTLSMSSVCFSFTFNFSPSHLISVVYIILSIYKVSNYENFNFSKTIFSSLYYLYYF